VREEARRERVDLRVAGEKRDADAARRERDHARRSTVPADDDTSREHRRDRYELRERRRERRTGTRTRDLAREDRLDLVVVEEREQPGADGDPRAPAGAARRERDRLPGGGNVEPGDAHASAVREHA
jgi:hypothetical protein